MSFGIVYSSSSGDLEREYSRKLENIGNICRSNLKAAFVPVLTAPLGVTVVAMHHWLGGSDLESYQTLGPCLLYTSWVAYQGPVYIDNKDSVAALAKKAQLAQHNIEYNAWNGAMCGIGAAQTCFGYCCSQGFLLHDKHA